MANAGLRRKPFSTAERHRRERGPLQAYMSVRWRFLPAWRSEPHGQRAFSVTNTVGRGPAAPTPLPRHHWYGRDSRDIINSRMNGPKQGVPDQVREHEVLLERVRVRIVGFATYLGCGNDAEDVAQVTMMVLHNKYAHVTGAEEMLKLGPRICANLALNWRRNKSNPAKAVELPVGLADASGQDPESAATEKELKGLLLKAIQGSDARCKELLRLRLAGANTKEIAADMGMTAGAVDTAYFRCLQRLRGALGGRK